MDVLSRDSRVCENLAAQSSVGTGIANGQKPVTNCQDGSSSWRTGDGQQAIGDAIVNVLNQAPPRTVVALCLASGLIAETRGPRGRTAYVWDEIPATEPEDMAQRLGIDPYTALTCFYGDVRPREIEELAAAGVQIVADVPDSLPEVIRVKVGSRARRLALC